MAFELPSEGIVVMEPTPPNILQTSGKTCHRFWTAKHFDGVLKALYVDRIRRSWQHARKHLVVGLPARQLESVEHSLDAQAYGDCCCIHGCSWIPVLISLLVLLRAIAVNALCSSGQLSPFE